MSFTLCKKMRGRIGIAALILAVAFLAAVPLIRKADERAFLKGLEENQQYEAALYYVHVQAVDASTSNPIQFRLRWDTEEVSPFFKGAGPTVVEKLSDGSTIFSSVGVIREESLRVEVTADSFHSEFIDVEAQCGGILSQDASRNLRVVTLIPRSSADPEPQSK